MASVAIMQPYLFQYIGYMNLVYASDKFVFYEEYEEEDLRVEEKTQTTN